MAEIRPIAHIHNDYTAKFGIPRQSNIIKGVQSRILFEPEYRNPDAVRGLELFSHIWLIWGFSQAARDTWTPTVRPPRLGGNIRMGVFATRSPFRPNSLGLSSVKIERIECCENAGPILHVVGADLMNNTPIYDIKPYLPYTDCHDDALAGFTENPTANQLEVRFPAHLAERLPQETVDALLEILAQDPRPSYHDDPHRVYGMEFGGYDIKFTIIDDIVSVSDVIRLS